ncbi:MAG: TOBE-like domain-containing protein, partial [Lapillicoccus sp.]
DRIAVLHKGRIEQVGTPEELYDRPANTFVMSFLGQVSTIEGRLVRPHDIVLERVEPDPDGRFPARAQGIVATVRRVVRLGFEVRVELVDDADGTELAAQITRGELDSLHLLEGDRVVARATRLPDLSPVMAPVEVSKVVAAGPIGERRTPAADGALV